MESELRRKEGQVRELEKNLAESERLIRDQDAELTVLRDAKQSGDGVTAVSFSPASLSAERLVAWGSVTGIQIHRLTSGVVPTDNSAKPNINVIVQPVDEDGDLVKIAGQLRVSAQLMENGEPGRQVAAIEYSLTDSRRLWTQGLVSSGLHATLQSTEVIPPQSQLQISATLDLSDDRSFTASELIDVQ